MALADIRPLARQAAEAGVGLGAFNVIHLEHAEMFAAAAEQTGRPVVLQISENAVRFHGGRLAPIGRACLAIAESSSAPVVVHLDHAESVDLVKEAVELGFTSVMYDASRLEYADNLRTTAEVAGWCHERGASVEAELGEVGGKDGVHAAGARTDPAEARDFVARTGVDLLAVAVGSSHAMTSREAVLDFGLVAALRAAVPVPLVLHGSSGVDDDGMRRAISAGITKVNVSTHVNGVFTRAIRAYLDANPAVVDSRKYLNAARTDVVAEVARLLRLYAGD